MNPHFLQPQTKTKTHNVSFQGKLSFCELGRYMSYILFSTKIDVNTTIKLAFEFGSMDIVKTLAKIPSIIFTAFSKSAELDWPQMPADLSKIDHCIPDFFQELLSYIITEKKTLPSPHHQQLLQSIGQDICTAATNGFCKLPKHIMICMSFWIHAKVNFFCNTP